MPAFHDGPSSPIFSPIGLDGNVTPARLRKSGVSQQCLDAFPSAPSGDCTCWGVPFRVGKPTLVRGNASVALRTQPVKTPWFVFLHTTDIEPPEFNKDGFIDSSSGMGRLKEAVADYVLVYADGSEARYTIRRRHQIGMISRGWGENCFEAVAHQKQFPLRPLHEPVLDGGQWPSQPTSWGQREGRTCNPDNKPWTYWLWAWENPHPRKAVVGLRIEPWAGALILGGLTAGKVASNPLRWNSRRKAILRLPKGTAFDPTLDDLGQSPHIQLDMGAVISLQPRPTYPNDTWARTFRNQPPGVAAHEILVEYTSHADARFHLAGGKALPVAKVETAKTSRSVVTPVAPSTQRVTLRVVDKTSRTPVAVKLHIHGEAGEYLAPVDRHRIPNRAWFEDYSCDQIALGTHKCTYIPGETVVDLPLGNVYIEVSKGLEIKPVRKVLRVTARTKSLTIPIQKVLPWRERGWVTADTHVHFLSPQTALLEAAGEDVNVVNLLASQWGELMTNVGDFDGATTIGSREAGGTGEHLVRVGTENRQHVLGHISLIGYNGPIIAPMTTGGPDESAIGDPVGCLLTEWARQCQRQDGIVVIPHFPNPRAEHAAVLLDGSADGVEMTSWGNLLGGIDPYGLSDWYRYLNCGYFHPVVAGTDKMSADTPVGAIRTYAKLPGRRDFTYDGWKDAVRSGNTFVSWGPLLDMAVEGKAPGQRIQMKRSGGTVDVTWEVASVTTPMTRVEAVVNGEIRASKRVGARAASGHFALKIDRSSWIALLVRGQYKGYPENIAAHSSPVIVKVQGSPFFAAADAMTILDQVEGALAYLDTIGTRAEDAAYKRMRLVLTSTHRRLHNQMHQCGAYHDHTPETDHAEHRK